MATTVSSTRHDLGTGEVPEFHKTLLIPKGTDREIALFHEAAHATIAQVYERVEQIGPSSTPTTLRIKFEVVGPRQQLGTPIYLASVRRRRVRGIAVAVAELERYAEADDFTAYTFAVIERIKSLLLDIASAEREGNTREILRQIRNTFLDKGWDRYRMPLARQTATRILNALADANEVNGEDVKKASKELAECHLNAIGLDIPAFDEEDDVEDGTEEEKIPCGDIGDSGGDGPVHTKTL